MTEQPQPSKPERKVSEEFAAVQAELNSEDNLFAMMREQLPSMLGMAFMFILTIALSLFIRPWYDIAGLQAFGAAGASQVRYIALELFMIFVFTAFILLLAKYKKEWIIKYGIMGVLSIALMYSTVPLAHMLVLDLEVEPFEYENGNEIEMSYLSHHGMDTHLTNSLIGSPGMWNDSINVYHNQDMLNDTPTWSMTHERLPYDDVGEVRVVVSDDYFSFTNQGYIWYADAETGELQDSYACHRYVDDADGNSNLEYLGTLSGTCALAFYADEAMYVIDQNNVLVRFNVFDESPGQLFYQAGWNLPPELKTQDSLEFAELIDEDKVLIITPNMAIVVQLEKTSTAFDPLAIDFKADAKLLFQTNATSNFTSADFGHSPWSENTINESVENEGFLILGEENGDVVSFEWKDDEFTPQTKMNLLGYADSIQSVRITDLDESGFTDLLVTTDVSANWHHGQLLKNRISFPVTEDLATSWFGQTENSSQFHAVYDNGSISIQSGEVTDDMMALEGLQLENGPLLAGLIVAIILMILLYVHSEWYVVNTVGVLVGSGVIVMLGVTFVPTLIMIFMIAAAIYDAWAVYSSKHMLALADTMIGLRLPILLVAPQEKGYSFIDETVSMKEMNTPPSERPKATSAPKKKGKDAMFMGLGDVIFPGMLVLSAAQYIEGTDGFLVAMTTLLGGLVGYFALMTYVARGRAQAGLPLLNGGAILGYIIGGLLIVGTAIFDFGITL
ncbi:MAG: presenilin family intramembrane aspartyl protease [Candidatus Poseidoniaceae archaeon]|nr:presenilin family intramembrane aspartyl protease [Candidatus Poseidoniaceae archaeon]